MRCREASELITRALEAPLTPREAIALRVHLTFCSLCRRMRRQMSLLARAGRAAGESREDVALSSEARHRLGEALKAAGRGDA